MFCVQFMKPFKKVVYSCLRKVYHKTKYTHKYQGIFQNEYEAIKKEEPFDFFFLIKKELLSLTCRQLL